MSFVRPSKDYSFYGQTTSLCETCLKLVPAKIVIEGDNVFYLKRCDEHGAQKTLISTDAAYYKSCKDFIKPGDLPLKFTEPHALRLSLRLRAVPRSRAAFLPGADRGQRRLQPHLPGVLRRILAAAHAQKSLAEIDAMLETLVASEGYPDLVQISGGEPTIHPQIVEILKLAKTKPIRHIMLNTNGIRIARDKAFVAELAALKPGFEVYLQFDSMKREALENIRGADLRKVREQALANLEDAGISTTLVCVVKKGVNDDEIGDIVRHALLTNACAASRSSRCRMPGRNVGFRQEPRPHAADRHPPRHRDPGGRGVRARTSFPCPAIPTPSPSPMACATARRSRRSRSSFRRRSFSISLRTRSRSRNTRR